MKIKPGSKVKFYSCHYQKWFTGTIIRKWEGTDRYNVSMDETIPRHTKNALIREDKLLIQKV